MKLRLALVGLVAVVGCSKSPASGPPRPALGHERGDCRPATQPDEVGTCEPGLLCLSNLCVRPPPADCKPIAEQLASQELGNYAEPEERAPIVAKYTTACRKAMVSKEQGECLAKATDKWAASQCAPLMFPELTATGSGDCKPITEKLRATMGRMMGNVADPSTKKMLDLALGVISESCERDAWPAALKQCITAAAETSDALTACNSTMPPELQQKIAERMATAMQASQTP